MLVRQARDDAAIAPVLGPAGFHACSHFLTRNGSHLRIKSEGGLRLKMLQDSAGTRTGTPSAASPLTARRGGPLRGRARVPGDKSISHRALILGALAVGETTIAGLLEGEDVINTAQAMRALGATVARTGERRW